VPGDHVFLPTRACVREGHGAPGTDGKPLCCEIRTGSGSKRRAELASFTTVSCRLRMCEIESGSANHIGNRIGYT